MFAGQAERVAVVVAAGVGEVEFVGGFGVGFGDLGKGALGGWAAGGQVVEEDVGEVDEGWGFGVTGEARGGRDEGEGGGGFVGVEGVGEAVGDDFCDAGVGDFGGGSLGGWVGFEDEVFGWAFVLAVGVVGGFGEVLSGVKARGFGVGGGRSFGMRLALWGIHAWSCVAEPTDCSPWVLGRQGSDDGGGGEALFDGVGGGLGNFVEEFEGGGSELDGAALEGVFGEGAVGLEVETDGWGKGEGEEFLRGKVFGFGEFEEVETEG